MFLPIFFDEDYNYIKNKERYSDELVKLRSFKSYGIEKVEKCCEAHKFSVKSRDIVKALKLYETLVK